MGTSATRPRVVISRLYPIRDKRVLLAHLRSLEWDYRSRFPASLEQGNLRLEARQAGYGRITREVFVVLEPLCEWAEAIQIAEAMSATQDVAMYLQSERVDDAAITDQG